ncbi:MAG: type II toxin-antitoxin system Phd/YefM family antitoxin [Symploca sp. SIO1B1]|nr:type II toxin-antitoxin system Phd/YefM family antitoxin [Symploca sp. SIO1B1]
MKRVTPTELRGNLYNLLDEILETGIPLEIDRGGKHLQIIPVEKVDKLQGLISRPEVIVGNPEELVEISWDQEVSLDLP